MDIPAEPTPRAVDSIQQQLTDYASNFRFADIPAEAVHIAKARVIDNLGCLIGAFFGEPCRAARKLAAQLPVPTGATIIGTTMKSTPEMAAFVNATTARDSEMVDTYHYPGSFHGHPSDLVTPLLAVAEHLKLSGRAYLASLVLGYEVYLAISNVFHNEAFDTTNLTVIASAVSAGKLYGLSPEQLSQCISMAAVANIIIRQPRKDTLTMYKSVACGHAGRAGIFAAQLALTGMEGPHLPFEGKAGWCKHVAGEGFVLKDMGAQGVPFRILDTRPKNRPAEGNCIAPMLAAEKLAILRDPEHVQEIILELSGYALMRAATERQLWNPETRETADHSAPYAVATALLFGKVTLRSFNDAHLWNPALRSLLPKIRAIENKEFTKAYDKHPAEHLTRITVVMKDGQRLTADAGGDEDDLSNEMSDAKVEEKFRDFAEETLGAKRVRRILDRLWHMEELENVSILPPEFAI